MSDHDDDVIIPGMGDDMEEFDEFGEPKIKGIPDEEDEFLFPADEEAL